MVYVKHFDILGIDTAQIPCVELQGVPNTATVGAVGLLGMDVTSEGREIYVCTGVNGAIYTWKCLKDGKDGVCVVKSEINGNGELILTLSDGNTLNAGVAKGEKGEPGKDGKDGKDGKGITSVSIYEGQLIVEYTDGTHIEVGRVTGENGVSIVKTEVNVNNELIITLSNDTVINVGVIKVERTKWADNAGKVNGFSVKKDEKGVIKIGGIAIPRKKKIWSGDLLIEKDGTATIDLAESLEVGDRIEVYANSDITVEDPAFGTATTSVSYLFEYMITSITKMQGEVYFTIDCKPYLAPYSSTAGSSKIITLPIEGEGSGDNITSLKISSILYEQFNTEGLEKRTDSITITKINKIIESEDEEESSDEDVGDNTGGEDVGDNTGGEYTEPTRASLVTDIRSLREGDKIYIVCEDDGTLYGAGAYENNYLPFVEVTPFDGDTNSIELSEDITGFTLQGLDLTENTTKLYLESGYLMQRGQSVNGFNVAESADADGTDWKFVIDGTGEVTATAQLANGDGKKILGDLNNMRFTCSNSTSLMPIKIYKLL